MEGVVYRLTEGQKPESLVILPESQFVMRNSGRTWLENRLGGLPPPGRRIMALSIALC